MGNQEVVMKMGRAHLKIIEGPMATALIVMKLTMT